MIEVRDFVITAIRDIETENSIAAALQRLGWPIAFRATDRAGFVLARAQYPEARIIISSDFPAIRENLPAGSILIQGRADALAPGAVAPPRHDHELHQLLLREVSTAPTSRLIFPEISQPVHLCGSVKGALFSAVLAINFAREFVARGDRVLLIDANLESPEIAQQLSIHEIRSRMVTTEFSFDVTEIDSLQYLAELAEGSLSHDRIIIDCGDLKLTPFLLTGKRFQDVLSSWILRSADSMHLVSEGSKDGINRISAIAHILPTITKLTHFDHSIFSWQRRSPRQSEKVVRDAQDELKLPTFLYSYDYRKLFSQNLEGAPAHALAPLTSPPRIIKEHIERIEEAVNSTSH